jgi:hypothetical protein
MSRKSQRLWATMALLAFGCALIVLGFRGWYIDELLPAQYLGYFCVGLCVLAPLGVNVWRGGPLDPRHDNSNGGPPAAA